MSHLARALLYTVEIYNSYYIDPDTTKRADVTLRTMASLLIGRHCT